MNKKLRFASEYVSLILSHQKISTWRLWDDKELTVNDIVDFLESGSNNHFATVKLTKVVEKPLGQFTDEDKEGHEQFASDEEMYKTLSNYYGKTVDKDTIAKIIWFELMELKMIQY